MEITLAPSSALNLLILFLVGIFAGIGNVLAGGGSLITMPLLILMGLDSSAANGTNRLSIVTQNIFAVFGFSKQKISNFKFSLMLTLPAVPGAVLGAIYAVSIEDHVFRRILSVVMILVLLLILSRRSRSHTGSYSENDVTAKQKILAMIAFAGIGFYVGFIQAGVGFIIIGVMTLFTKLDLVRINAHKVTVIGLITIATIGVFTFYGKIIWSLAIALAAGNGLGGWMGSYIAVRGGEVWIKRVLVVSVLALAIKLSGIADCF